MASDSTSKGIAAAPLEEEDSIGFASVDGKNYVDLLLTRLELVVLREPKRLGMGDVVQPICPSVSGKSIPEWALNAMELPNGYWCVRIPVPPSCSNEQTVATASSYKRGITKYLVLFEARRQEREFHIIVETELEAKGDPLRVQACREWFEKRRADKETWVARRAAELRTAGERLRAAADEVADRRLEAEIAERRRKRAELDQSSASAVTPEGSTK